MKCSTKQQQQQQSSHHCAPFLVVAATSRLWWCLVTVLMVAPLVTFGAPETAEFDNFDINADWKIDTVPVTPVPAGIEGMLSLGGIGDQPVAPAPVGPIGASIPPQPNNVATDLSGWGPLGKMHPRLLAKDRMVSAYHNRMLDPRYRHLKGYGHQALAPERSPEKTGRHTISHRLAGFF